MNTNKDLLHYTIFIELCGVILGITLSTIIILVEFNKPTLKPYYPNKVTIDQIMGVYDEQRTH